MKAKETIVQIAGSQKYSELVDCWKSVSNEPSLMEDDTIFHQICELLNAVSRKIDDAKIRFLDSVTRSCRPPDALPYKVYPEAVGHAQKALDAFDRQLNKQLVVFIQAFGVVKAAIERVAEEQLAVA